MRRRVLALAGAVALAAGGLAAAPAVVAAPAVAADPPGGAFVRTAPIRALDTRDTGSPLGAGETRLLDLSSRVSTTATAVVVNLTVTEPTAAGFLTVYPSDTGRPLASSINKRAGETRSNSVTVALPANGSRIVAVYNQIASTHVVVDVSGYYDPQAVFSTGGSYYAGLAFRADDTRTRGAGVGPGTTYEILLPNPDGLTDVTAVAANVTAVDPTGPGFLTLWDGVGGVPPVSTVNYGSDPVTPNFAVVPVRQDAAGLHLRVRNGVGTVGVVVDVFGWYADVTAAASLYVPVPPRRIADTRTLGGPIPGGSTRDLTFTSPGMRRVAVNLNLTAVDATAPTYLTAFRPFGPRPTVSTLNPPPVVAVANAAQVLTSLAASGRYGVSVFNFAGSVQVVADVQGYFVGVAT